MDLEPIKVTPTWRNLRIREENIFERLYRFIVHESILHYLERIKYWVEVGGDSNFLPILFQIEKEDSKHPRYLKFNSKELEDEVSLNI